MACHFVTALNVPGIGRTKKKIHAPGSAQQDLADEFEESFDVDISIDVEALPNDAEAMHAAFDISFEPGDVVGKLLAFIAQVRACSDDVREYLLQIATSLGCPSWEIKLWGIDCFCHLADEEEDLPPLTNGKKWANYLLSGPEWDIIRLAHDCLEILKTAHGELSAEKAPMCYKVFPLVEMLQSKWDDLSESKQHEPVHEALAAGLKNMAKWYRKADDTSIYFVSHVLDPTWKLSYVQVAWHAEFVEDNMEHLREIYLKYHAKYHATKGTHPRIATTQNPTNTLCRQNSTTERWMTQIVKAAKPATSNRERQVSDLFAELNRFFESDPLSRTECPDIIAWYGVHLSLLMGSEKFGALQRLRAVYHDGHLEAVKESWMEIDPNFDIDDE
ncbi:hypothetical protein V8E52_011317 [Russula decolorans]